jgi:hypothetical protein
VLQYQTNGNRSARGMGAGETRCGLSGRFQASSWPSVAPRRRHTFLLRVALLLPGFFYINDGVVTVFLLSPPLPTSSPAGEIHRSPTITALSISPKAPPCSCASPEPARNLSRHQRSSSAIAFFPRPPTNRLNHLTVSSTPWRVASSHISRSNFLLLL